jgi:hypothetical protein
MVILIDPKLKPFSNEYMQQCSQHLLPTPYMPVLQSSCQFTHKYPMILKEVLWGPHFKDEKIKT